MSKPHVAAVRSCQGFVAPEDATLIDAFVSYLENGQEPATEDTIRTYLGELRTFMRVLGLAPGTRVDALVTRPNLLRVITTIPHERVSSRRNLFYAVRAFARFLRDMEVLGEDAYAAIVAMKLRARYEPVRRSLTPDQVDAVVRALAQDGDTAPSERIMNLAMFALMTYTGIRNTEMCRLRLADVDFAAGLVHVRKGKGNKARVLGLPYRVVPILRLYLDVRHAGADDYFFVGPRSGRPLNRDAVVKRFARMSRRLGIPVAAHICRRSFATIRAHQGVPLDKLQVVMGHADIKTTRDYVQTRALDVAHEMRSW